MNKTVLAKRTKQPA